jgi:hypothetical protein
VDKRKIITTSNVKSFQRETNDKVFMQFAITIAYVQAGVPIQEQHRNQNFPSSSFLNLFLHFTIYTELKNGTHARPLPFTSLTLSDL